MASWCHVQAPDFMTTGIILHLIACPLSTVANARKRMLQVRWPPVFRNWDHLGLFTQFAHGQNTDIQKLCVSCRTCSHFHTTSRVLVLLYLSIWLHWTRCPNMEIKWTPSMFSIQGVWGIPLLPRAMTSLCELWKHSFSSFSLTF